MNPQCEDGYTKIANEILDALCRFRIPGEQRQCLDFILRKTYGYHKKEDAISNSQFCEGTGLLKGNVTRALKELSEKQLVIKSDNGKYPTYRFNKNYTEWRELSKKQPVIKKATSVIKNDNRLLSKAMDTKDNSTKENITKDIEVASDKPKQPAKQKKKSLLSLDEEDFFKVLEENPLYSGIDIRKLNEKLKVWCAGKGFKPTRQRLINWLNREDKQIINATQSHPRATTVHQAQVVARDQIAAELLRIRNGKNNQPGEADPLCLEFEKP